MSTQALVQSSDRTTPDRVLHRLEWQVLRRLDGILQGDYHSLFMGGGLDFAELREYQPPDDIRHIDWNVTARMDSPFVRKFLEDREINAWFLLDLSPSMAFGALERRKESVLLDFVAVLARLLTRNGNRVGAVLFDNDAVVTIPPKGGRLQVLRLINDIQRQQSSPAGTMTDLTQLLETAFNCISRRSLVFLVSDFICMPGWDRAMDQLNRRHELLAVRLWDPRELDLPDVGVVLVEDSETGAQLSVDTSDRGFRRRFHEASRQREMELEQTFKRAGVHELPLSTEDDLVLAIMRFASLRRRTRLRQWQGV
ncbi:MAG: DUF58 domain-containing protein [Chloroflexi bacterium]|nr:DUF58 domain-containing protein [Chloroflexota bacterium]